MKNVIAAVLLLGGCAAPREAPPDVPLLNAEVPGVRTMSQAAANLKAHDEIPYELTPGLGMGLGSCRTQFVAVISHDTEMVPATLLRMRTASLS